MITNTTSASTATHHIIFESYKSMTEWYDELLKFTAENHAFLSKTVLIQMNLQNNLRKHIDWLYKNNPMTDAQLKNFAVKYYKDLDNMLEELGKAIATFYEKEISLTYNFASLTDKDLKETQNKLYSYSVISDNFKTQGEIK